MSFPYSKLDAAHTGHICCQCRFEIKSLEFVDEVKPGMYIHAGCGGSVDTAWQNAQLVPELQTEVARLNLSVKAWKTKAIARRKRIDVLEAALVKTTKKKK